MSLLPETPSGLNHVVLQVRDLDRAHHFWSELLGFRHVGTFHPREPNGGEQPRMRFYSGERDGKLRHHDIGLIEDPSMPADLTRHPQILHHVAITYPTREAWQRQIQFLVSKGMSPFRQVERGATYSAHLHDPDGNEIELVYELPRAGWEDLRRQRPRDVVTAPGSRRPSRPLPNAHSPRA